MATSPIFSILIMKLEEQRAGSDASAMDAGIPRAYRGGHTATAGLAPMTYPVRGALLVGVVGRARALVHVGVDAGARLVQADLEHTRGTPPSHQWARALGDEKDLVRWLTRAALGAARAPHGKKRAQVGRTGPACAASWAEVPRCFYCPAVSSPGGGIEILAHSAMKVRKTSD